VGTAPLGCPSGRRPDLCTAGVGRTLLSVAFGLPLIVAFATFLVLSLHVSWPCIESLALYQTAQLRIALSNYVHPASENSLSAGGWPSRYVFRYSYRELDAPPVAVSRVGRDADGDQEVLWIRSSPLRVPSTELERCNKDATIYL